MVNTFTTATELYQKARLRLLVVVFDKSQESSSILDEILFKLTEEQKQNRDNNSLLASRKKPWVLNCLHMTQNISRGIDPIKYWNGYRSTEWHIIATFALDILSISGSGAPIEAVYTHTCASLLSKKDCQITVECPIN
ncbi:hypothetical protein DdX_10793 [Ditylenchus destructor]|uniref:HAT C-terminal dimerisation domain-containing protein n=1 Tax=Ditylenchus destructor TaxID=166010 RepID=A0AAD4N143_9BILA|nr:hypothetical protein DdX_10793 [Ditylenchus destructor]